MKDLDETLRGALGGDEPAPDDGFAREVLAQLPRRRRRGLPAIATVIALGLGALGFLLVLGWGAPPLGAMTGLGLGGLVILGAFAWVAIAAALAED